MKIAINKCFGGFDLSEAVHEKLIELGVPLYTDWKAIPEGDAPYVMKEEGSSFGKYSSNFRDSEKRTHPLLIRAIEEVGEDKASGDFGKIRIIEIPDDVKWLIDEYDGIESIHEEHRSW